MAEDLTHTTELARVEDVDPMLAFFASPDVTDALHKSAWTVQEEIQILADIARGNTDVGLGYEQPPSHKERIAAIKELRKIIETALEAAGGLKRVSERLDTLDPNGNPVSIHLEGMRAVVAPAMKITGRLLDEGLATQKTISVDEPEKGES